MIQKTKDFFQIRFRPFKAPAFRAFFIAQVLSLVGTWSHELARSYIALDIGGTTAALGSILLAGALPSLFLALHGGVLADRHSPQKILMITKSLLAISALSFFAACHFYQIELWMIYIFAFIDGLLNSYDSPAYTSTFQRLVPRKDFKMAVVLQSSMFHMCRMLGPAVAGLIMVLTDAHWVFLFDALSYSGVLLAIRTVKLRSLDRLHKTSATTVLESTRSYLKDGISYFLKTPSLRYKVLQLILTLSILTPILNVVFRSYLKNRFQLDGSEFGFIFSFPALGSMCGALLFIAANFNEPIKLLRVSIPSILVCIFFMLFITSQNLAILLLGFSGFFTYLSVNSITQSLHFEIKEEYRGRLGSVISLGFLAISPLMSFPIALFTDKFGFEKGILSPAILFSIGSIILAYLHGRLPSRIFRKKANIPPTTGNPYALSVKPDVKKPFSEYN